MGQAIELETDFAAAMQELSARAAEAIADKAELQAAADLSLLTSAIHSLGRRMENLEDAIVQKFEALQFRRIEEQLSAIRESESVNQKLFDSLHRELISYRDNFVRDALQKPFIRDLLVLFDDLNSIVGQTQGPAAEGESQPAPTHSGDNLNNALHFLVEILHRLEVKEVEPKEKVDRSLHRVISYEPAASAAEDGDIVRRLKPGFVWHDQVLRPEEVVAKRFE